MLRSHFLLLVIVLRTVKQIECSKIQDMLPGYYDSDTVKRFEEDWHKYQRAFENAIGTGLQQEFGRSSINIFEETRPISHLLAKGFSLSDGVVSVYFIDMVLRELPLLVRPELKMSLSNNHQSIFSRVGRMFIDTTYYVARNKSSEVYAHPRDQKDMSPFSLQQVDRFGKVAITAEDCLLRGFSVVTLSGDSVNLGHTPASVYDCKFTVEISAPHSGAPPVIAPYFPKGPKEKLELLLTAPILEELQAKLQGALYSYVNTSVLFGPEVRDFSEKQRDLFKNYAEFIRNFVFKVNQNTLKSNKGVVQMPNYDISIDSTWVDQPDATCSVGLRDLRLYGLETAYVGRSGGPYNENSPNAAADVIIFSSLQIRGKVTHDDGNGSTVYDFTAELIDITVNIVIKIERSNTEILEMQMTGWRSLAFGIIPWNTHYNERISYQSLVYGYILNELPAQVKKHLTSILGAVVNDGNNQPDGASGGAGAGDSGGDGGGGSSGGGGDDEPLVHENDGKSIGGKKEFFTDDNLDKDFFTDDNIKKDFFTDDNIKKDFFTDDNIKKDFFTDDNIKKDFFTDDNIKKDFFTDDNIEKDSFSDGKGGVTGETDNKGGVTGESDIKKDFFTDDNIEKDVFTDGKGGVTGETDNKGGVTDEERVTDGNGGVTGDADIMNDFFTDDNIEKDIFTDDNIEKDIFIDGKEGVTGETDNKGGVTDEDKVTDGNGGVTGETDNKGIVTDEDRVTDGNGGVTGETDNKGGVTDEEGVTDGNGGVTGETDNKGGVTDEEGITDGNGAVTDEEGITDDNGSVIDEDPVTDGNGGVTDEERVTDGNGGLTGETDNKGGMTDEDRVTDGNGEMIDEERVTDGNEGASGESNNEGGMTDEERVTDGNGEGTGETDNKGRVTDEDRVADGDGGVTDEDRVDDRKSKPFLDDNFFSDFESRRVVAKNNIRNSKKNNDNKKGVKRKRISNIKKEAARPNYRVGEATVEENMNNNVKDNSNMAKKPALPPNVHNMRRLNNPRMSENEIR